MAVFKQASGASARFFLGKEASYGVPAEPMEGILLPFNTTDLDPKQEVQAPGTQYEGPDPLEPLRRYVKIGGTVNVPLDGKALGHLLAAVMGAPVSADFPPVAIANAVVADLSGGLVSIPAAGHGMEPGMSVLIEGSSNYDGKHVLDKATTADTLAFAHTYTAETIANATAYLGGDSLAGLAVVNKGGGKVAIPLPRHGFVPGDRVTIAGSTNYNATFEVQQGTSVGQIVITHAYAAETFAAGAVIHPALRRHLFAFREAMDSYIAEIQHPDVNFYQRFHGAMAGGLGLRLGGDGEILAAITMAASRDERASTPLVADPERVGLARFDFEKITLIAEGGVTSRVLKTFEVNISRNLDTDTGYVIGGGANLSIITPGKGSVGGRLEALFTKEEGPVLLAKAESGEPTDVKIVFVRPHEFMVLTHPALKLGRGGVPVPSQRGLTVNLNWQGYKDTYSTGSAVEYAIINSIQNY